MIKPKGGKGVIFMPLLRYTIDGTVDIVKAAIERLKTFEEIAVNMNPQGYYVAYSGG
jgi:hypothetical protein